MEIRLVSNTNYPESDNCTDKDFIKFIEDYEREPFLVYVNGTRLENVRKFSITLEKNVAQDSNSIPSMPWVYSVEYFTDDPMDDACIEWQKRIK